MFEHALLTEQRRPWTIAVSFTMQSSVLGALVLLSIITIERLPVVDLPVPLPPLPAAPRAVEIVAAQRASAPASTAPRAVFSEPARIPQRVAMIVDEVPTEAPSISLGGLAGTGLPPDSIRGLPSTPRSSCG